MSTPANHAAPRGLHAFWRFLLWAGGLLLAGTLLLAFELFHSGTDLRALRHGLVEHAEANWRKQFQLGTGPFTLGLARAGLALVNLPPEARAALSAVRGAEVSINEWQGTGAQADRAGMLERAEATMSGRGWDRLVGVASKGNVVAIYVPRRISSQRSLRICLLVVEERQMVLVAARINPEPLLALVNDLHGTRLPVLPGKFTRGGKSG